MNEEEGDERNSFSGVEYVRNFWSTKGDEKIWTEHLNDLEEEAGVKFTDYDLLSLYFC